jgi:hypothetical protein
MFSAQQVVGEIKSAQHIKTRARNADGCDGMVVHSKIVELSLASELHHPALRVQ